MPPSVAKRVGPYDIVSSIGAGGRGEVYGAKNRRLDRVVVKILPTDLSNHPQFRELFDREAKAFSSLSHRHICPLYDVGHQEATGYLITEYLIRSRHIYYKDLRHNQI